MMPREEHYVGRRAMEMEAEGRRKRGMTKRRWLDRVRDDIKDKGLHPWGGSTRPSDTETNIRDCIHGEEVHDRATRRRISSKEPT